MPRRMAHKNLYEKYIQLAQYISKHMITLRIGLLIFYWAWEHILHFHLLKTYAVLWSLFLQIIPLKTLAEQSLI